MSGQFARRLYPFGDRELTLLKLWISVWYSVKPWFVSFLVPGVVAELAINGSSPFRVSMSGQKPPTGHGSPPRLPASVTMGKPAVWD